MLKKEISELLSISKSATSTALDCLSDFKKNNKVSFTRDKKVNKEIKTNVDIKLDKIIFNILEKTGIKIITEERKNKIKNIKNEYYFIVDPLDGTINYIRNLAECSISIALFYGDQPIFGVLGIFPSKKIIWGGKKIGSYENNIKLSVSNIEKKSDSIVCTGFPSRLDIKKSKFTNNFHQYLKIRMLGSASISMYYLAKGSIDIYFENEIMIWDVAAGIAIIEGAGGKVKITKGNYLYSHNVTATNNKVKI